MLLLLLLLLQLALLAASIDCIVAAVAMCLLQLLLQLLLLLLQPLSALVERLQLVSSSVLSQACFHALGLRAPLAPQRHPLVVV